MLDEDLREEVKEALQRVERLRNESREAGVI